MNSRLIPYCKPDIGEREIAAVVESMRNGWLTTGPNVEKFESCFARRTGIQEAVAFSSCTAALHVALKTMGVGPGDEVVMPALSFVAGAQSVLDLGGQPVFADVDPQTLCVTVATVAAAVTARTKVIIAMPYAGRPLDIIPIVRYAHERGIKVLEDAAHAAGMLDRGAWAGTQSDAAAYSFYATKNLTSAEGGMLVTRDAALAERARVLRLHGMSRDAWKRYAADGSWRYDVLEPGYKYNFPDTLAAIGLVQLERLDEMQARRAAIAERYLSRISRIPGLSAQALPANEGDRQSWCMFAILVDEVQAGIGRDDLIEALAGAGIGTSVHYIPTYLFAGYRSLAPHGLQHTDRVWRQLISLPLYPSMADSDVNKVLSELERIVSESLEKRRLQPV